MSCAQINEPIEVPFGYLTRGSEEPGEKGDRGEGSRSDESVYSRLVTIWWCSLLPIYFGPLLILCVTCWLVVICS